MSKISPAQIQMAEEEIKNSAKQIDYSTAEFTIETIYNKLTREEYYIPDYQRRDIWTKQDKSRFIESLLMGIPIPSIFLWENSDVILEVVDGAQRLYTIKGFIDNKFSLIKSKKMPSIGGLMFKDLTPARQRKFYNTVIRSVQLTEKADAATRFDLFERINTTGKKLTQAELRRGLLGGPFNDMINNLCTNVNFKKLAPINETMVSSGLDNEVISRFFAFSDDLANYNNSIKEFIFNYVEKMNINFKKDPSLQNNYENRFITLIDFYQINYPTGFKTPRGIRSNTAFDAMMVGAYLAQQIDPNVLTKVTPDNCDQFFNSDAFKKAVTSDASNTKSKVYHRINLVKDFFLSL